MLKSGPSGTPSLGVESFQVYFPVRIVDASGAPVTGREFWVEFLPKPGFPPFKEVKRKFTTDDKGNFHLYSFVETDGQANVLLSVTPLFQYAGGEANKAILWRHPVKLRFGYPDVESVYKDPFVVTLAPGGGIQDKTLPAPPVSTLPPLPSPSQEAEEFPWRTVAIVALGIGILAVGYFVVFPAIFGRKD